jgi:hypothetical protein
MTLFNLHVLDALPARQLETVYIVHGDTLPHVIACEGEAHRLMLEARSQQLA